MFFHTWMRASEGMAHSREVRNLMPSPPSACTSWLTMPSCASSIHDHTVAATTPEIRNGRMIRPRSTVDWVTRWSTAAVTMETARVSTTAMTTK